MLPLNTDYTALSALRCMCPRGAGYCLTLDACTAETSERICPCCMALGLCCTHVQHTEAGCRGAIEAAVKTQQHPPETQQQQLLLLYFLWRLQASSGIHSCVFVHVVALQATCVKAVQGANPPLQ